jgi:hypothetical protein
MKNEVVSIKAFREIKDQKNAHLEYQTQVAAMDKIQLLEEMTKLQDQRAKQKDLELSEMIKGVALFNMLHKTAETEALKELTRSYLRNLELQIRKYSKIDSMTL